MSGCRKRAKNRPEPLWHPIVEEEEEEEKAASSSEDPNPSVSKQSQGNPSPPSPRTFKAIQAAMNDSSDDEKVDHGGRVGSVSPRTLLAIQQALSEEDHGAGECMPTLNNLTTKLQENISRPLPQVVISSSEEEAEPSPKEKIDYKEKPQGQSSHVKGHLLVSSSDDEMEEVIGQRNKALHFAVLQQPSKKEEMTEKGQLTEDAGTGSRWHTVKKDGNTELHSTETEVQTGPLEDRKNKLTESLEETNRNDLKSESSEESQSEGTVSGGVMTLGIHNF